MNVQVTPISPERLADEVTGLVMSRAGRVRLAIDGPPAAGPQALADRVGARLRELGRAAVVVLAADFLRPASVRLEYGREDPDEFLDGWLDVGGLRREVLDPAAPEGSGRVLPRLWDATADRAYREPYTTLPADGVVVLAGALLLNRGLPARPHGAPAHDPGRPGEENGGRGPLDPPGLRPLRAGAHPVRERRTYWS